ncbi:MAG: flagellar motor protein PomA, partial [Bosea sp. 32-68-6]
MDLATGLGIFGGIVTICAIIIIDGGNFAAFYDKHAVIIIFGGATASTMTRFPFAV